MAACLSFGGQGRFWRPLTVTNCPCPRRKAHRPALYPVRKKLTSQAGRTVCLHSCGLPALSHCTRQTAPGTSRHRQRVSDCSGGQACPLGMPLAFLDASDTSTKRDWDETLSHVSSQSPFLQDFSLIRFQVIVIILKSFLGQLHQFFIFFLRSSISAFLKPNGSDGSLTGR